MKAFFKDEKKIIVNSMDYTEALVGRAFKDNSEDKYVTVEERFDVNDDFDGLVLTIGEKIITEEEVQERIDTAVNTALEEQQREFDVILKEAVEQAVEETKAATQLKSATDINTAKSVDPSEENIRVNASKCSIVVDEDKITVVDEGLVPYVGGPSVEPKKWVGLLVDLNTKVQGDIYNIEDVDYTEAKRWGASNDTTFIMWITPDRNGDVIRFTNVEDESQFVDITIEFTEGD
jgi:hypothetical protein